MPGTAPAQSPRAYAALAYLYGLVVVFLWPDSITYLRNDPWGYATPRNGLYVLILGFIMGTPERPDLAQEIWAMIAGVLLALLPWLALATLNPVFWTDPWYATAPVVSAILTVLFITLATRGALQR